MKEFEPWIWFGAVLWSIVVSAVVLYGTLGNHIGELHDEVRRLRADIRCLVEPNERDVARRLSERPSGC